MSISDDITKTEFTRKEPPAQGELERLRERAALPADFLEFLGSSNGGEGFLGEAYVVIWSVEDIVELNKLYEVERYAPGLLLFGSDGGGEGYAFDTTQEGPPVVRVPLVGMNRSLMCVEGRSFGDFVTKAISSV